MLSPHYLHFIADSVAILVEKGLVSGIDALGTNMLIMSALVCDLDQESAAEIDVLLEAKGLHIVMAWKLYKKAVSDRNRIEASEAMVDLRAILEKHRDD